jgi:hypothetical protein
MPDGIGPLTFLDHPKLDPAGLCPPAVGAEQNAVPPCRSGNVVDAELAAPAKMRPD